MTSQHATPVLVLGSEPALGLHPLARIELSGGSEGAFSEGWLQRFLFGHPQILPIDELEPVFGPLVPLCRELPTPVGPLDLVYVNHQGLLTLVECKLWRNPEARREVVGQLLTIDEMMPIRERWLALIERTLGELHEALG